MSSDAIIVSDRGGNFWVIMLLSSVPSKAACRKIGPTL